MSKRYKYTKEDEDFLRQYYPICDWKSIEERFPSVSRQGIYRKCQKLGIKSNYDRTDISKIIESRTKWTDEEIDILKKNYSELPIYELCVLLPNRNKAMIIAKARQYNLQSYTKLQQLWKNEEIQFIYNHWETLSDKSMADCIDRTPKAIKAKRNELGLYRSDPNEVNYESLQKFLRGQLQQWKNKSMEQCDYQCVLTGSKEFEIHHKYSFSPIVNEFLNKYPEYADKSIDDYSQEDLFLITERFQEIHDKYPLGVCVDKKLHLLFHTIYGKTLNTPKQWDAFYDNYKNGKYDNI